MGGGGTLSAILNPIQHNQQPFHGQLVRGEDDPVLWEGVLRENLGQILEQVVVEATVIVHHTAQSRTLTYYIAGATTPN